MKTTIGLFLCQVALSKAFVPMRAGRGTVAVPVPVPSSLLAKKQSDEIPSSTEEVDVVVIGSGLAGLSCAALLSHCDKKVVVLEAHDTPGGAVSVSFFSFLYFSFFDQGRIVSYRIVSSNGAFVPCQSPLVLYETNDSHTHRNPSLLLFLLHYLIQNI